MSNLSGETVGEFDELFVGDNKYIHITNNNQLINGAGYVTSGGNTNVPTLTYLVKNVRNFIYKKWWI